MESTSSLFSSNKEDVIKPLLPANMNGMGLTTAFAQPAAAEQPQIEPEKPAVTSSVLASIEAPATNLEGMAPRMNESDTSTAARHLSNAVGEAIGAFFKLTPVEPKADNENLAGPEADNENFGVKARSFIPVAQPAGPRNF